MSAPEPETDRAVVSVADVVMGERGEGRQLRAAGVVALLLHFGAFALVIPMQPTTFDLADRDLTVVRRYEPPKPPEVTRPVRKHATRVPIPDATPFEPEPLLEEEVDPLPPEPATTDYVLGAPVTAPEPAVVADAMDIETDGLAPPRLLRRVPPQYDPERARRGVQGKVDMQIVIGEAGTVEFARVINGTEDDELDRRALEAVQQWEFAPAMLAGVAVPVRAMVTINYRIY